MTKWISRKDAAEMLGVHPQTISNFADRGIIHQKKCRRHCFFPLGEIEALAECDIYSVDKIREDIGRMRTEMDEVFTITRKEYIERKEAFYRYFKGAQTWGKYKDIVLAMVRVSSDTLTDREYDIVKRVLDCQTIDSIAGWYNLSRQRIYNIFCKCIRKMAAYPDRVRAELENAQKEFEKVRAENDCLKIQMSAMLLAEKRGEKLSEVKADSIDRFRKVPPFTNLLREECLSVRAKNCLRAADIETIGQLVSFTRLELMKFRNFGRKSLNEIELLLEKYNLSFGMWKDPQRKY